jgi:hypothetical protein
MFNLVRREAELHLAELHLLEGRDGRSKHLNLFFTYENPGWACEPPVELLREADPLPLAGERPMATKIMLRRSIALTSAFNSFKLLEDSGRAE